MSRLKRVLAPFEINREQHQERIAQGIEKHRKADAQLEVADANGRLVSGVQVSYRLKKHAFWHGANCFMLDELETPEKNEMYKERFAEVFNQATLPFYWTDLEPEKGKVRFAKDSVKIYRRPAPDLCLEYCDEKNITPKLHCLNYDQWSPVWLPRHDVPEIKRQLERRIREIAERYRERIHCMEVINETLNPFVSEEIEKRDGRQSTDFFREDDLISWSFDVARRYLPDNELVINEATRNAWDVSRGERSWYALSILDAIRRGASIDAIGLQFHMFRRREMEEEQALPFYDPKRLFGVMDFYEQHFRRPLQVTEVTIPAYSNEAEDEETQARVIENLYSIWFSHPSMEAITYWNLVDGYAAHALQGDMSNGENYYYGGLLRFDFSPKPAYHMMQELFSHRWHSAGSVCTDGSGCASMRGFKGEYEVILRKNGQETRCGMQLDGKPVKLVLT